MSNERPNEFLPWRGQLTAPDALPEKGLEDKEQSWQRLAERLQKQPRRRGITWWVAAACLILAFFFPATHLFRARPTRPNHIAHRSSVQRQPVTFAQSQLVTPTPSQPVLPTRLQPMTSAHRRSVTLTRPPKAVPSAPTLAFINPSEPTPASIIPDPAPNLAPIRAVAPHSAPPPHRQLRVVYLNELNKEPGPSAVAAREPAFLRLSTASAGDWNVNPNPAPIIKIDISSHNH